jgi:hypothetical protein
MPFNNFINTGAQEVTRSRTATLTNLESRPFPPLFYGDQPTMNFFFAYNGLIETFSGANNYGLVVTLAHPTAAPFGGYYSLSCGGVTTDQLLWNTNAAGIQEELNALPAISAVGGVYVIGQFPDFLIYANQGGAFPAITANASLLQPDSSITLTVLTAGTGTTRQQVQLSLRQAILASQTSWAQIASPYAGWSGILPLNTNVASAAIAELGATNPSMREMDTVLTIQVSYSNANTTTLTTYHQSPVKLRLP